MRLAILPAAAMVAAFWLAPSSAAAGDPVAGREKARQCAPCHGLDGIAVMPIAPNIAGESPVYLETQLEAFRSGQREHEIMSVIARQLSDEDIADLVAWYSAIKVSATMPDLPK